MLFTLLATIYIYSQIILALHDSEPTHFISKTGNTMTLTSFEYYQLAVHDLEFNPCIKVFGMYWRLN